MHVVQDAPTSKRRKEGRTKPLGISQPLELPEQRWGSLSMDFVTHLRTAASGYDCITTFVDCFTKRVHLVPSKATNSAEEVALLFFRDIFGLHGLPDSIVSDLDSRFRAKLWTQLMDCCRVNLKMATMKHPKTDAAT